MAGRVPACSYCRRPASHEWRCLLDEVQPITLVKKTTVITTIQHVLFFFQHIPEYAMGWLLKWLPMLTVNQSINSLTQV